MDADELLAIVTHHGGTRAFATRLKVSQRIVQYWLAGKRQVRPVIEDRIRTLKPSKKRMTNQKER